MFRHIVRRFPNVTASLATSAVIGTGFLGSVGVQPTRCEEGRKEIPRSAARTMGRLSLTSSQQDEVIASQLVEAYMTYFQGAHSDLTENDLSEILIGCGILDKHIVATFYHMLLLKEATRRDKKANAGANAPVAKKKSKAAGVEDLDLPDVVSFKTFFDVCIMLNQGDDKQKVEFIFDFVDITKRGLIDKYEMATAVRHLLWCQTNWYGEEVLYDGPFDYDLFFEVPTESIAQLKANRFAHEMVLAVPGGSRLAGLNKKQFGQFMLKGGKEVKYLKGLFSVLGAYEPPEFANNVE